MVIGVHIGEEEIFARYVELQVPHKELDRRDEYST